MLVSGRFLVIFCSDPKMVSTTIDSASNTNHSQSEEDSSSQGPRLFTRFMKEQCWRKHAIVPGRDPERWRYDKAGNPVCRQMTGCDGLVCHEYDHIVPFAKGIIPLPLLSGTYIL